MSTISKAEWNRAIDKLLEDDEKLKGKVLIVKDDRTHPHIFPLFNRLVTEDLIRHYAEAMGDPNPLWRDSMYAKFTRWGGIIAPPTFNFALGQSVVQLNPGDWVPGWADFYGGSKHLYFKPIRPGDEFRAVDKYLGITDKSNPAKPYRLFQQSNERTFINQRDEVVIVSIGWCICMVAYPGEYDAITKSVFADSERHHFTEEELDFIHNAYDEEIEGKWRRGAEVRFWEDVVEGEELHPVIKGPVNIIDIVSSMAACGFAWEGAFATKWQLNRSIVRPELADPVSGEYHTPIVTHFSDSIAQRFGLPHAFSAGWQNEANIAHLICNWMGDDGFVKCLDLQHRAVLFLGEMSTQKGKVRRKYVENGEHLVDLEVWGENREGIGHTVGSATVRLVSRQG
jgi:acyl dehydratase